jgi:hypothetical protein
MLWRMSIEQYGSTVQFERVCRIDVVTVVRIGKMSTTDRMAGSVNKIKCKIKKNYADEPKFLKELISDLMRKYRVFS